MIFSLVKLWQRIFKYVAWGYLDLEYTKVELECRTLSCHSGLLETMYYGLSSLVHRVGEVKMMLDSG